MAQSLASNMPPCPKKMYVILGAGCTASQAHIDATRSCRAVLNEPRLTCGVAGGSYARGLRKSNTSGILARHRSVTSMKQY
jgi:hypothetical protein